jgi:phosphatidylserine synthase
MSNTDRLFDIRVGLQYVACGVLVLVLYWIGRQNEDNVDFFLLSFAALMLGTPLLVSLYRVPVGRVEPLPLRILVAFLVSLAGIALTVLITQLVPDPPHLAPIIIGVPLIVWAYLGSR